jgi:hypothetical protein
MNLSNVSSNDVPMCAVDPAEPIRQKLQVSLLKKTLEAQRQQQAELTKMLDGKGRILDIRV